MKRCGLCAALGLLAGCSEPPPRPRPVEVPISEYRVGDTARAAEPASSATSSFSSSASANEREASRESVAAVPEEPRGADGAETKSAPATQLDTKGGFLGATFGSTPRQYRGLVAVDKRSDPATYRAGAKSYGGVALRDVFYIFRKNKLATIQFAAKNNDDCKPMRDMLTRELGPPQRATESTSLWRGEKIALRFVVTNSGACSGTVLSKEHARAEFDAM